MIVADDDAWAICSPKKTASQSLDGMLVPQFGKQVGEIHGSEWSGAGKRVLVIRNPYERLASMFWFALKEHVSDHRPDLGPEEWCRRVLAGQHVEKAVEREWCRNQRQHADEFTPSVVCRLEDGLSRVCEAIGAGVLEQRRNETASAKAKRKSFAETFDGVCASVRCAIDAWCKPDIEAWY